MFRSAMAVFRRGGVRAWLVILALGLLSTPSRAEESDAPTEELPLVSLRSAADDGRVDVVGTKPLSYRRVMLRLRNRSNGPLALDLAGAWLKPREGRSCQRLGLGPAVDAEERKSRGPGTIVVTLDAKKTIEIVLQTVCLDAGREAPTDQTFVLGLTPMPSVREKVIRWWADHPTASQSAVNAAIWHNRSQVHVKPGVVEAYRRPKNRLAAARNGTYFALDRGELTSLDVDGVRRILGTEIFQAIPRDDAIYAVGLGSRRRPEIWRLELTGLRPWSRVAALDGSERLIAVERAPRGKLFFVTDRGIRLWSRDTGAVSVALTRGPFSEISFRRASENRLLVVLRKPGRSQGYQGGERTKGRSETSELISVDLRSGRAAQLKTFWNVKGMRAGALGIFGLSPSGDLRRLAGLTFRDLARGSYKRILAIGLEGVWLETDDGVRYLDAKGRVRFEKDLTISDGVAYRIDGTTDDLVFADVRGFWRIVVGDGGRLESVVAVEESSSDD